MKIQLIITSFLIVCVTLLNAQNLKSSAQTNRNSSSVKKSDVISCSEKEYKKQDGPDPIIVKTCLYKSFKFVNTGSPDYTGKYSWDYNLYKKQNGKYVEVSNSALFNQNVDKLLSILNQKNLKDFLEFASTPETKDCLEGMKPPKFTIDQFQIEYQDHKFCFTSSFGLSSACRNVDGTFVYFTLVEIKQYLKE